ncbi:glutathione S-transferase APIC-like [Salvia hispanica]|uniref:glutathione S-transferase APIC-like n=1 Tax=Salvia hispanica TaxID=49212 RepID=UPI0020094BB9|nr:glutathione S-transferase APIC-like [Salvia hispanica]
MAIKVYGQPASSATRRVLVALEEKGLDYELVLIDLYTGQHKKEPLISINPFGQVPGFEDGDLQLFESRAIASYIAHAYADKGSPLISKDPKKMAIMGVWVEVEGEKFNVAAQLLSYELYLKPIKLGLTADEAVVEKRQAELAAVLDIYEARLGKSKYLGGDDFSLADLLHIPILYNLQKTKVKAVFDARPAVAAWAANLLARPASHKINAA